jgi:hypothetical protein
LSNDSLLAATKGRLLVRADRGQRQFAHIVSTNYYHHNMLWNRRFPNTDTFYLPNGELPQKTTVLSLSNKASVTALPRKSAPKKFNALLPPEICA